MKQPSSSSYSFKKTGFQVVSVLDHYVISFAGNPPITGKDTEKDEVHTIILVIKFS